MLGKTSVFPGLNQDHKIMREKDTCQATVCFVMAQNANFQHSTELSAIYHDPLGIMEQLRSAAEFKCCEFAIIL